MKKLDFPKLNLITYPTPFRELKNLRKELGCKPRLFMKRDDLTEIGLGGNKNRKLDYVMVEAVEQGADTVVTWAGIQSNHCRQTLAYARTLGMDCHLILNGTGDEPIQGNRFLFDVMGATLHFEPDEDKCPALCEQVVEQLRAEGKKPYYVPIGASVPLGSIGYIDSVREIAEQSAAIGVKPDCIFITSGSSGTQGGAEIGQRLYLPDCRVHGVAVSRWRAEQSAKVAAMCNEIAEFIDIPDRFTPDDIIVHDEYFGGKYAVPTPEGIEAIKLVGRTEGIILDPVYSGKTMSCLVDFLRKGMLDDKEAIVFVHTGGSPAIYNYVEWFR